MEDTTSLMDKVFSDINGDTFTIRSLLESAEVQLKVCKDVETRLAADLPIADGAFAVIHHLVGDAIMLAALGGAETIIQMDFGTIEDEGVAAANRKIEVIGGALDHLISSILKKKEPTTSS